MKGRASYLAPWWRFWDPTSGAMGGVIFSVVILLLGYLADWGLDLWALPAVCR